MFFPFVSCCGADALRVSDRHHFAIFHQTVRMSGFDLTKNRVNFVSLIYSVRLTASVSQYSYVLLRTLVYDLVIEWLRHHREQNSNFRRRSKSHSSSIGDMIP